MQTQHFPDIAASSDLSSDLLETFGQQLSDVMSAIQVCPPTPLPLTEVGGFRMPKAVVALGALQHLKQGLRTWVSEDHV